MQCSRNEVDWLLQFIRLVESPVVFAHNNVNTGHIMVGTPFEKVIT